MTKEELNKLVKKSIQVNYANRSRLRTQIKEELSSIVDNPVKYKEVKKTDLYLAGYLDQLVLLESQYNKLAKKVESVDVLMFDYEGVMTDTLQDFMDYSVYVKTETATPLAQHTNIEAYIQGRVGCLGYQQSQLQKIADKYLVA